MIRRRIRSAITGRFTTSRDPASTVAERVRPYVSSDAPLRAAQKTLHERGYGDVDRDTAAAVADAVLVAAGAKR